MVFIYKNINNNTIYNFISDSEVTIRKTPIDIIRGFLPDDLFTIDGYNRVKVTSYITEWNNIFDKACNIYYYIDKANKSIHKFILFDFNDDEKSINIFNGPYVIEINGGMMHIEPNENDYITDTIEEANQILGNN